MARIIATAETAENERTTEVIKKVSMLEDAMSNFFG